MEQVKHNFISNNCIGGRLYECLNEQYQNPFIWTIVMPNDFLYLVENYDKINFKNIKIEYGVFTNRPWKKYRYLIDNKVGLVAYHYEKDNNVEKPTKIDSDLHIKDIEHYMVSKYLQRLERMTNKAPIFVFSGFSLPQFDVSDENIEKFLSIKTPYKKILLTRNKEFLKRKAKNTKIFYAPSGNALINAREICKILWKK